MRIKGKILSFILVLGIWFPSFSFPADEKAIYLNAFAESSTAYLNDAFLLLGSIADNLMTEALSPETALDMAGNIQKRIRMVRAKVRLVMLTKIKPLDRKLLTLVENSYACLDQQAWALMKYIQEYTPSTAKKFEERRAECLSRIQSVAGFYAGLPPAPELPEPLSTR